MGAEQSKLNTQLRKYSHDNVKISEADYTWAKGLINKYVNDLILPYIKTHSPFPVRRPEYTGSVYEHLKTEAADEVDVMIIMHTTRNEVVAEGVVPGWARLRVREGSPYRQYANFQGYLLSDELLRKLASLVQRAINDIMQISQPVNLVMVYHGPAVQVNIVEKLTNKTLSVDLVMSFELGEEFYITKNYSDSSPSPRVTCDRRTLLRRSFSVKEKAILRDMDRDSGCRHELLRIVKTMVRNDYSLIQFKLHTYLLKTAFLRYNSELSWKSSWSKEMLRERFIDFLEDLKFSLKQKCLPHFFIPKINLLDEFKASVLEDMANRLERLANSEKERDRLFAGKQNRYHLERIIGESAEPVENQSCAFYWVLALFFVACIVVVALAMK